MSTAVRLAAEKNAGADSSRGAAAGSRARLEADDAAGRRLELAWMLEGAAAALKERQAGDMAGAIDSAVAKVSKSNRDHACGV